MHHTDVADAIHPHLRGERPVPSGGTHPEKGKPSVRRGRKATDVWQAKHGCAPER